MSERRWKFGLPLLTKELTELANRKRTYVVRFLYAAGLFIGGMVAIYGTVDVAGGDVRLGVGKDIFRSLVSLQFWLILLFLPSTASSALTIEKERDTLTLLLITTMSPWSVLFQKFLSRLTPMVSLLLLAFPLLAVAYSYGGVSTAALVASIVLLLLFAAEVCAVAVMCSAYCRTTPEALMSTYGVLLGLYLFPPLWPPHLFGFMTGNVMQTANGVAVSGFAMTGMATFGFLLLGRRFLQRRAFVPPRNVLLQAFQWLDKRFEAMNAVTGGIVLVNDKNSLPDDRPVAWRETAKKSLGTFRYLFRVCTALELPILFVGASVNITTVRTGSTISTLLFVLWWIATAMICVHASGVITAERSRQTIDALLTTPLTGADILQQKMAGVWRLIAVLCLPFATIYGFQLWFRGFDVGYLLGSVATAVVFLPTIAWIALAVGLRIRATIKAILTSVGVVVGLCVFPFVLAVIVDTAVGTGGTLLSAGIMSLSPIKIIGLLEGRGTLYDRISDAEFWLTLAVIPCYALLVWLVRRDCLVKADDLLQRVPELPLPGVEPVFDFVSTESSPALADAI